MFAACFYALKLVKFAKIKRRKYSKKGVKWILNSYFDSFTLGSFFSNQNIGRKDT